MRIIYYRDEAGDITGYHPLNKDWSNEELSARLTEYNSQAERATSRNKTAYCAEFKDDSIEAYLVNADSKRKGYMKEAVEAAIQAIEEARDCVEELRV